VEGHQPMIGDAIVSNGGGLLVAIDKLPGANTRGVTHAVEQALDELRPGLSGVKIDNSVFRPATYVRDGLHNLVIALVAGAVLMLLALVALRRSWRSILIAAASICLSMITAATVLDVLGYSFNALTFTGLAVGLVVVVDQALSDDRRVGRPLGIGALIAVVVAAPLFLVRGMTGAFIHPAVLAYLLAVGCSLIVGVTFAPALRSVLEGVGGKARHLRTSGLMSRAREAYGRCLGWMARLPRALALTMCVPGLVLLGFAPTLGEPQRPTFHDRDVVVSLEGYKDMSLPEIDRVARRTSTLLERLPGVRDVAAGAGRAVNSGEMGETNTAQLWVSVRPGADYERTLQEVNGVVSQLPGVLSHVGTYESERSTGVFAGSGSSPVIRVYGQDYPVLARSAAEIRHAILGIPGVQSARALLPESEPVLQVQVNLQKARQYGIKPGDVRREVSTLLSGLTVGNFFEQQKVFDVVVRGTPAIRSSLSSVGALLLDTPYGGHVRLHQLASVHVVSNPIDIRHDSVSRFVDVSVRLDGSDLGAVRAEIERRLAQLHYPLEYHAELLPTAPASETPAGRFLSYAVAAALLVFLLLQAACGSWRLAAIVFSTVPLAVTGGILVAVAMGSQNSLGAAAGVLAVLVVAARQLVALISYRPEDGDAPSRESLLRAAQERLGPVVSSTVVIALAALPLVVLGDVPGTEILYPLAAVVLGGLVTLLLVALLITPTLCLRLGFGSQAREVAVATPAPPRDIRPQEV
ncbi:MAG: efflux RND transporter permease subunit, partial [Solirubrobacteraceae bacterium]